MRIEAAMTGRSAGVNGVPAGVPDRVGAGGALYDWSISL